MSALKRIICLAAAAALLWTSGCGGAESQSQAEPATRSQWEYVPQSLEELHLPVVSEDPFCGIWMTTTELANCIGSDREETEQSITAQLNAVQALGVNTLMLHVRSSGLAWYESDNYPCVSSLPDYDVVQLVIEHAHKLGIAVQLWCNPLRLRPEEEMECFSGTQIGDWYESGSLCVRMVNGTCFLNPAEPEVRALVAADAAALMERYDADGFHIDDYFYPTTDPAFDAAEFEASGASDLKAWRTEQISEMVRSIYASVHSVSDELLFSISPTGKFSANADELYADVCRWGSEEGFCDQLIPQLYYGYQNGTCPFTDTAEMWKKTVSCNKVELIFGLCTYKVGQEDPWAGGGSMEWITDVYLPARQTCHSMELGAEGVCYFSLSTTLSLPESELEALRQVWRKSSADALEPESSQTAS